MDELMPQQIVQNHFQTKIIKLDLLHHHNHVTYYNAVTNYGSMTLIVEKIILNDCVEKGKQSPNDGKQWIRSRQARLRMRNMLIGQGKIATPLIFEQQIKKIRDDYVICMSLCQNIRPITLQQIIQLQAQSHYIDLVVNAYQLHKQSYQYTIKTYELNHCLQSTTTNNIFLNFTEISIEEYNQQSNRIKFKTFIKHIAQAIKLSISQRMNQIIFNKESPFVFNVQKVEECEEWFDLWLVFNIALDETVVVRSQSRVKTCTVRKLQGVPKFQFNGRHYDKYRFKEGSCMDGIISLTFSDLKEKFFQDNRIYQMSTSPYLLVRKLPLNPQSLIYMHTKLSYDDLIYVNEQISKVQFINFIIGYMKYLQPIINELHFYEKDNIIQLIFTNKTGKVRKTIIKFYDRYVVKDEQLSMIIQKSKIKNAVISLEKMKLTDSFLIFLANCDKALHFRSINLSYCSKLTQSGVQLLISSPFFKNINILKLDGLPCNHFSHVKFGLSLRQISLNGCNVTEESQQLDLSAFALQKISALNYHIMLRFNDTLKYLSINSYFLADNFKYLKNLSLVQLKLKVSQGKKNINTFLNNFNFLSPKQNSVRLFSDSPTRKTLKLLDLSSSTIKLKELKSILYIQSLQTLILNQIENDKITDLTLPNNILNLSIENSNITLETFQKLIQKMNIMIKLTIKGSSRLQQKLIQQYCTNIKYINMLEVDQTQLNYKTVNKRYSVQGYYIHVDRLLRRQKQLEFYYILMKVVDKCKVVYLMVDEDGDGDGDGDKDGERNGGKFDVLVRKVLSFIHLWMNKYRNRFKSQIYINEIDVNRLVNYRAKTKSSQHFKVHLTSSNALQITPSKLPRSSNSNHTNLTQNKQYKSDNKQQQYYNNNFTLDHFIFTFHQIIKLHSNSFIQINIRDNRVLGRQVIDLLKRFGCNKIRSIDFRNCLFSYEEVEKELFCLPFLERINNGQYQINLNRDNVEEETLMNLLRFYLKLSTNGHIALTINASYLDHHELFFTTLTEIILHFKPSLARLRLRFTNIEFKEQCLPYWHTIFQLQSLKHLQIAYLNDIMRQDERLLMFDYFSKIEKLSLQILKLDLNMINICQMINVRYLKELVLIFNEITINEYNLSKIIKKAFNLTQLKLDMNNIPFNALNKLSDSITKLTNLTSLTINLQNCALKQNHIYELLSNLQQNQLLQYIEININYCCFNGEQLVKILVGLQGKLKMCHIVIYGNREQSSKGPTDSRQRGNGYSSRNEGELLLNGIELYL